MERLGTTAPRAIRLALAQQPTTAGKVLFAWALCAGPALTRAATASWSDGVLTLDAKSESWRLELVRARPVLYSRVAALLGPGVVRSLHIVAGDHR